MTGASMMRPASNCSCIERHLRSRPARRSDRTTCPSGDFGLQDVDQHHVADGKLGRRLGVPAVELAVGDDAFALRADVDEDLVLVDPDDRAFDHVAVLEALDVAVLLGEQLGHRGWLGPRRRWPQREPRPAPLPRRRARLRARRPQSPPCSPPALALRRRGGLRDGGGRGNLGHGDRLGDRRDLFGDAASGSGASSATGSATASAPALLGDRFEAPAPPRRPASATASGSGGLLGDRLGAVPPRRPARRPLQAPAPPRRPARRPLQAPAPPRRPAPGRAPLPAPRRLPRHPRLALSRPSDTSAVASATTGSSCVRRPRRRPRSPVLRRSWPRRRAPPPVSGVVPACCSSVKGWSYLCLGFRPKQKRRPSLARAVVVIRVGPCACGGPLLRWRRSGEIFGCTPRWAARV